MSLNLSPSTFQSCDPNFLSFCSNRRISSQPAPLPLLALLPSSPFLSLSAPPPGPLQIHVYLFTKASTSTATGPEFCLVQAALDFFADSMVVAHFRCVQHQVFLRCDFSHLSIAEAASGSSIADRFSQIRTFTSHIAIALLKSLESNDPCCKSCDMTLSSLLSVGQGVSSTLSKLPNSHRLLCPARGRVLHRTAERVLRTTVCLRLLVLRQLPRNH